MPLRQQRGADRPHQPRVRRSDDLPSHILLEGRQNRVVLERAALHHDLPPQRIGVRNAHNLGENVLDDRTAQARHDVVGRLAVLLLGHHA